ncbi:hypothetical protein P7C70_g7686, partial [Phenoliferia sp. Uapishka_3]
MAVLLPPEILVIIIQLAVDHLPIQERNRQLAALSLVSREFQPPAYDNLYGHLRVNWIAGTAARLQQSLRANRSLANLVTLFEARELPFVAWRTAWILPIFEDYEQLAAAVKRAKVWRVHERERLRSSRRRLEVQDNVEAATSEEAAGAVDRSERERDHDAEDDDDWVQSMLDSEALAAWEAEGHARWGVGMSDLPGFEWLQMIGSFSQLKHLVLRDWSYSVPTRLYRSPQLRPSQLILSQLESFATHTSNSGITALILNEAQHLQKLRFSAYSPSSNELTFIPPVSITHLTLEFAFFPTILSPLFKEFSTILAKGQLRSLDIVVSGFVLPGTLIEGTLPSLASWSEVATVLLPSLQSLRIRLNSYSATGPSGTDQHAFAPLLFKSTLENLTLHFWPSPAFISFLPPSLVTLALGPMDHSSVSTDTVVKISDLFDTLRRKQNLPRLEKVGIPCVGAEDSEFEDQERMREEFAADGVKVLSTGFWAPVTMRLRNLEHQFP